MNIAGRSLRTLVTKVRSSASALAAGALLLSSPGAIGAETLKQVVEAALKTHPRVLEAASQYRAAGHDVAQARGGFMPTVDLNLAGGSERTDSPSTRALGAGTPNLTRREAGLLVSQNLYNGKATTSELERQKARQEASASRLAEVREDIALRVTDLFIEVIKNRALVRLAEQNLKAHLATQEKVRQRVQGGVSQKTDL